MINRFTSHNTPPAAPADCRASVAALSARLKRGQRGASLIEIMVVLVILLTGVFLVIRIFPIGFGTLRAHEDRTLAVRLSEQLLGQVRNDAASLPAGVLFSYIKPDKSLGFVPCRDPDDLNVFNPDPADFCMDANTAATPNAYFDDVNKFRFIKGEPVKIPLATSSTQTLKSQTGANYTLTTGSAYTLKFGPVYLDANIVDPDSIPADTTLADSFLSVYGAPLTAINVQSGGEGTRTGSNGNTVTGYLRSSETYLIDFGGDGEDAEIMFAPRTAKSPARSVPYRIFKVTGSYETSAGVIVQFNTTVQVDDVDTALATPNEPVWHKIYLTPATKTSPISDVSPGSVTVTRTFSRIARGDAWDAADPYQYKLVSDNIPTTGGGLTPANFGVLNFNPSGANYSEPTAYGQRAFTAYVDYAVLDWHIIHEDRDVPSSFLASGGLIPVRTTLAFIKRTGDTNSDNTIYGGLYNDQNPATGSQTNDIQVFNLDDPTGKPLVSGDYATAVPATDPVDFYLDGDTRGGSYRTGTIYLNTKRLPSGTKLRVLYKAEGDWAVSLQKAYQSYTQVYTTPAGGTPTPDTRPGKTGYDGFGKDGMGNTAQLWFPLADLNKSVVATLQYTFTANGKNYTRRVEPQQITIDQKGAAPDDFYAYVNLNPTAGTGAKSYIPTTASDVLGAGKTWQDEFALAGTNWYVVGAAQGVSVKSRVVWHDNNSTSNAWRIQDLDTFLTPASN